jgi:hypothetical protein
MKYHYRIIKRREQTGCYPFVVQENVGLVSDWRYDKSFPTLEEAEAYVLDKTDPQVICAYRKV